MASQVNYKYAQTNIELFHQLQRNGYTTEEIGRVRKAYETVTKRFGGLYRPSGKTFIAHLIGTASILGSLYLPLDFVIAGLVHAVYQHGDFGDLPKNDVDVKRKTIYTAIGRMAEEYVWLYSQLHWNTKTLIALHHNIPNLSFVDRHILLIRLCNELEDFLDGGILYCHNAKSRQLGLKEQGPFLIESAEKLGHPALAAALKHTISDTLRRSINPDLILEPKGQGCFQAIPFSYRQTIALTASQMGFRIMSFFMETYGVLREKAYPHKKWLFQMRKQLQPRFSRK